MHQMVHLGHGQVRLISRKDMLLWGTVLKLQVNHGRSQACWLWHTEALSSLRCWTWLLLSNLFLLLVKSLLLLDIFHFSIFLSRTLFVSIVFKWYNFTVLWEIIAPLIFLYAFLVPAFYIITILPCLQILQYGLLSQNMALHLNLPALIMG